MGLEGGRDELCELLYLWRTECVDVDSRGRKCKERMQTVLRDVQPALPVGDSNSASGGSGGAGAGGGRANPAERAAVSVAPSTVSYGPADASAVSSGSNNGCAGRAFADFRDVDCASIDEVKSALASMGLLDVLSELLRKH